MFGAELVPIISPEKSSTWVVPVTSNRLQITFSRRYTVEVLLKLGRLRGSRRRLGPVEVPRISSTIRSWNLLSSLHQEHDLGREMAIHRGTIIWSRQRINLALERTRACVMANFRRLLAILETYAWSAAGTYARSYICMHLDVIREEHRIRHVGFPATLSGHTFAATENGSSARAHLTFRLASRFTCVRATFHHLTVARVYEI